MRGAAAASPRFGAQALRQVPVSGAAQAPPCGRQEERQVLMMRALQPVMPEAPRGRLAG